MLFQGLLIMVAWMAILWAIHLKIKDAGVVDFGWAGGLVLLAAFYAIAGTGSMPQRLLQAIAVGLWGTRLALYVLFNRVIGKHEDERYRELRAKWKENLPIKFFFFFEFQAVLDAVLSIPFLAIAMNPATTLSILQWIGLAVWVTAVVGEASADHQLRKFRSNPENRGKVCNAGLWNYSRHPNYFFEWLIWIAYFLMALPAPYGWISIICPMIMLYFLFKITGIPATEEHALKSRGDEYRKYQQTTSVFVPLPKRKASA